MSTKPKFYLLSSVIILLPLLGSIYLYVLSNTTEKYYNENTNGKELMELIEHSEQIELLRKGAINLLNSRERLINESFIHFNLFYKCLFSIFVIDIIFLFFIYKLYFRDTEFIPNG